MAFELLQNQIRQGGRRMINDNRAIQLTHKQLKEIISESVEEVFTRLGIDSSDPLSMQRDFQHLRDWRLSVEAIKKKGFITLISFIAASVCAMIWIGIKTSLHN